jgi:hypothetical protein
MNVKLCSRSRRSKQSFVSAYLFEYWKCFGMDELSIVYCIQETVRVIRGRWH